MLKHINHGAGFKDLTAYINQRKGKTMTNEQNKSPPALPAMPERIARLPKDHRGFPVPCFVAWVNGVPDFRAVDAPKIAEAHNKQLCWICGKPRWRNLAFIIGPMCAINRTISEPPSHRDCAEFSIKACPFLSRPKMRRNEKDLPEHRQCPGFGLKRNPGVSLLWITRSYKPFRAPGGVLFEIGDPIETHWYAEGRKATRAEIMASIESGLPSLQELAEAEGPGAVAALHAYTERALKLIPQDIGGAYDRPEQIPAR